MGGLDIRDDSDISPFTECLLADEHLGLPWASRPAMTSSADIVTAGGPSLELLATSLPLAIRSAATSSRTR